MSPTSCELAVGADQEQKVLNVGLMRAAVAVAGGMVEFTVRGVSMGAAIPDGTRIRIRSPHVETWREGRVVACAAFRTLIAHRIVYVGRGELALPFIITHGDGNWLCDAPILRSTVVGEVYEFELLNDWRTIAPPCLGFWRRVVMRASRLFYATILERSPRTALRTGQMLSRLRVLPRLIGIRLHLRHPAHVRN